jgi:hypothetical protein
MPRNLTRYYLMDGAIVRGEARTKRNGIRLLHKFPDLLLVRLHDTPSVRRLEAWEVRG